MTIASSKSRALQLRPAGVPAPFSRMARSEVARVEIGPIRRPDLDWPETAPRPGSAEALARLCLSPPLRSRHMNDFACTRYDEIEHSGLTTKRHRLSFLV